MKKIILFTVLTGIVIFFSEKLSLVISNHRTISLICMEIVWMRLRDNLKFCSSKFNKSHGMYGRLRWASTSQLNYNTCNFCLIRILLSRVTLLECETRVFSHQSVYFPIFMFVALVYVCAVQTKHAPFEFSSTGVRLYSNWMFCESLVDEVWRKKEEIHTKFNLVREKW